MMYQHERQPYIEKAKQPKLVSQTSIEPGSPIATPEIREPPFVDPVVAGYKRDINIMEEVLNEVDHVSALKLIFMAMNVMGVTEEKQSIPNELGIVRYSVKEGVEEVLHRIIFTSVPSGLAATAKEHAEQVYRINVWTPMPGAVGAQEESR